MVMMLVRCRFVFLREMDLGSNDDALQDHVNLQDYLEYLCTNSFQVRLFNVLGRVPRRDDYSVVCSENCSPFFANMIIKRRVAGKMNGFTIDVSLVSINAIIGPSCNSCGNSCTSFVSADDFIA